MALPLGAIAVDNGTILVLIPLVVLPIAAIAFARSGALWSSLGRGRFAIDPDLPQGRPPELVSPVDPAIQAAEARQMIEAKSYRRQRRGERAIDIDAEIARAFDTASAVPQLPREELRAKLRIEIRQLVIARNERRMRRGEPPLDVEAETERQLADCVGSA